MPASSAADPRHPTEEEVNERPRSRGPDSPWTRGDAVASVPPMAEGESGARTRPELFRLTARARAAG